MSNNIPKFEIINKDELPINGYGISWSSINKGFIFKTQHIKYGYNEFEFIKYKNKKLYMKYNGEYVEIFSSSFLKGNISKITNHITKNFKYNIGDRFNDITLTDREHRNNGYADIKYYKYTCRKCGWSDGWIEERDISRRGGMCSCCTSATVVLGINSIYDTHRYLVEDFGLDVEFAKTHTRGTGVKGEFTCKYCGNKKQNRIFHVIQQNTIACNCGDGRSFPMKVVYSILKQLDVCFKTELSSFDFDWCGKYRYDFFVEDINTIIEVNGNQHYEETKRGRTLKEEQENDRLKQELAFQNGISDYIIIDARNSNIDWLKENVNKSKMSELYDLSTIDWNKALEFACSNIVKDVCDYWNNKKEYETVATLSKLFSLSVGTIRRYLQRGCKLGWCNYDAKYEYNKSLMTTSKYMSKKVEILDKDTEAILGMFDSITELSSKSLELFGVEMKKSGISNVCTGRRNMYKGYKFRFSNNSI